MLTLRSIFFTFLCPGTVTVVIPYFILSGLRAADVEDWTLGHSLSLPLIGIGAGILLRCIWDFAVAGHGTLAPVDPPRHLVVRGLYRYVRNPMYVGVALILVGEALFFQSPELVYYAMGFLTLAHLFVVLYEEPTLRRQFGQSYEVYRGTVHRWVPHRPRKSAA